MENHKNPITWYEISKDIIIPAISAISTLVIGIIIALIIKKRDERGKTKETLIDTYMEYMNRRITKYSFETLVITHDLYLDMSINYGKYFTEHSNSHLARDLIKKRREKFQNKIEEFDYKDVNWTFYAYKFSFLLGRKKYNNEVKSLEKNISIQLNSEESKISFLVQLKDGIIENKMVSENMNASDIDKIEYGLNMIESYVTKKYNNHQFNLFMPYDNKIADLVKEY